MLAAILLGALVVRMAWALTRPTSDAALNLLPDQHDYLSLARSVLHGDGFAFHDPRFPGELRAFRTPGYPVFLALFGGSARAVRAVQAILDSSTVLAIYCLARRLVRSRRSEQVTLLAAAFVALNPFLVYFSGLLLTETLFTAMLAWAMVLLVQPRGSAFSAKLLAAGLLLTTSILVRPSGIALPIALGVAAVFLWRRADAPRSHVTGESPVTQVAMNPSIDNPYQLRRLALQGCLAAVAMLLLTLLTILPWAVRNHTVLGRWIPLDTNSGFTLYDGFNPTATGASDQTFVKQMPQLQMMSELKRSEYLGALARGYALGHPGRVITLAFAKLARTWSPITLSSEFGQLRYQLIAAAFAVPFDLLIIAGLFSSQMSRATKAFLLTPAVYFSIVHALTVGSLRYRIPAEPPLAILAAAGLVQASEKMRSRSMANLGPLA